MMNGGAAHLWEGTAERSFNATTLAPRLVVFDLDGTLLPDPNQSVLSTRVRTAIQAALTQGVIVTLASGRMFKSLRPFARQLGLSAPLLCHHGARIQASDAPQPLYSRTLETALAREAVALAEARGWHVVLYADEEVFVRQPCFEERFYTELLGGLTLVQDWEEVFAVHAVDKVLCVAAEEEIPLLMAEYRALCDGRATVVRSHRYLMEVIPAGISKGQAVAWLADYLGVPPEQVLAVGDQENDVEMLRWAGTGVAMGNAPELVKAVADWVAPPVEEDGAAVALERWLAGR